MANNHTNIIYMARDGQILKELPVNGNAEDHLQDKSVLNVKDIITFAETSTHRRHTPHCGAADREEHRHRRRGTASSWGANIGSTLL